MINSWLSKQSLIERWHSLFRNKKTSDTVRTVAQERLAYDYGTRLFVNDCFTLYKILRGWKQRADKYLAGEGYIRRSYKTPMMWTEPVRLMGASPFPLPFVADSRLICYRTRAVRLNAMTFWSYSSPPVRGWIARLAQLSDSLGLQLDAGIVWDAIPFSFIADWFINISEWMHANASAGDWFKYDITILEKCASMTLSEVYSFDWERVNVGSPFPVANSICNISHSWYGRYPGLGPQIRGIDFELKDNPLKLNRVINAAAIGVQKLKPTKAKRKPLKPREVLSNPTIPWWVSNRPNAVSAARAQKRQKWHHFGNASTR
jgi:hypothetical protein